jgi:WD40 repeat protein
VLSAAFSLDGGRIVTASADGTARIWEATTGRRITMLRGHDDTVWSAAFSSNIARIVTASADRTVRIWNAMTGREITRVALDAAVTALAVHDGNIALGDALGRIHVFEAEEFIGARRPTS